MGCGPACSDNFDLSILPTWNQNFFFAFTRENSPVQPLTIKPDPLTGSQIMRPYPLTEELYLTIDLILVQDIPTSDLQNVCR